MSKAKATLVWANISIVVGSTGSCLFDQSFWVCVGMVAVALLLNGWLADQEDRGKFND
jgi:hypothetical protein